MITPRRHLLALGLGGGLMAVLRGAAAQPAADCAPARPLRFQVDSDWQPDLSATAAAALSRALLALH